MAEGWFTVANPKSRRTHLMKVIRGMESKNWVHLRISPAAGWPIEIRLTPPSNYKV